MGDISFHTALASLDKALVPQPTLIDGRTERDWLCFLSDLASAINFYEGNNQLHGNWKPFLIKDPVFLLAHISKTKFSRYHSTYISACTKLETMSDADTDPSFGMAFNQLFNDITRVFKLIEQWTSYMQLSAEVYEFKTYLVKKVKEEFSELFWGINSLREAMAALPATKNIDQVEYYIFDSWDELIWKQSRGKTPYLELLGLKEAPLTPTLTEYYHALKAAGDRVFVFFRTLISHSAKAFEQQKEKKSRYPDTTLLRAFVHLLKAHQNQLNQLSQKHLEFYYQDVLKQTPLPPLPDSVFVYAQLAKTDATLLLPAGTLFDGGVDVKKDPILFAAQKDANLNPASLASVYTLAAVPAGQDTYALYLQNIPGPGVLKTDVQGNPLGWNLFGSTGPVPGAEVKLGLAFASPMLLLREGSRFISVTLHFSEELSPLFITRANFYLSTQLAWLNATAMASFGSADLTKKTKQLTIEFNLPLSAPAIEAFAQNPDGYASSWPLLKIEFDTVCNPDTPPAIISVDITVSVTGVKNLQLYNDFGGLSAKGPFSPFGPVPQVSSSFIVGSNEIFSKPLTYFYMGLDWDALPNPPDFQTYYQQYNNYISYHKIVHTDAASAAANTSANAASPGVTPDVRKQSWLAKRWSNIKNGFKAVKNAVVSGAGKIINIPVAIGKSIVSMLRGPINPYKPTVANTPYNNACFTVDFDMMQGQSWLKLDIGSRQSFTFSAKSAVTTSMYKPPATCSSPAPAVPAQVLFQVKPPITTIANPTCVLSGSSYFGYDPLSVTQPGYANPRQVDPGIQSAAFKLSETSSSGYIRMNLTGPAPGFGAAMYPNVVSDIALFNAFVISNKKPVTDIAPPANPPYTPVVGALTAHYSATQSYQFNGSAQPYPVQCFLYSPFANYLVYDSTQQLPDYAYDVLPAGTKKANGVPLFPTLAYNGYLYICLQNLLPAASLNLYFELSRAMGSIQDKRETHYFYLSNAGWKSLPMLSDQTKGFICSGILSVAVPADVAGLSPVMPGNGYWLCIAANGNLSSFGQTVLLQTNGLELQRVGNNFATNENSPRLPAASITKSLVAIPEIATVTQPFASFGGRGLEICGRMYRRVSSRMKRKDRLVSAPDYCSMICQEYNDVFYARAVYKADTRCTNVYVVKAYASSAEVSAFLPTVSECREKEIQLFLARHSSPFAYTNVLSYKPQYVRVTATVIANTGAAGTELGKVISQALDVFISPWIQSSSAQIGIDQGLEAWQVVDLIRGIAGVKQVEDVAFTTWTEETAFNALTNEGPNCHIISQDAGLVAQEGNLLVSCLNHKINCQ